MELARKIPAQRRERKKMWRRLQLTARSWLLGDVPAADGKPPLSCGGSALPTSPGGASEAPGSKQSQGPLPFQLLPSTTAPSEVDLFIPLLQARHERPGFDVFITTPLENQRPAALLMLDPSGLKFWDQLVPVDSLNPLTFALMRFDLLDPPPR